MSPSWIWSDKIANDHIARVGYNHFISNKQGKWNNCFSKFSNPVLPPIFISTILQSVRKENLAHYFPYDVKLGLLAHSRSFTSYGKWCAKFKNFSHEVFNFSPGNKNRRQNPVWEFTKTITPFAPLVGYEVIITNSRYALVGYFITSYPTRAHGNNCYINHRNLWSIA